MPSGTGRSSSHFKGESLVSATGKWSAEIYVNRKRHVLGQFKSEREAGVAHARAHYKLKGCQPQQSEMQPKARKKQVTPPQLTESNSSSTLSASMNGAAAMPSESIGSSSSASSSVGPKVRQEPPRKKRRLEPKLKPSVFDEFCEASFEERNENLRQTIESLKTIHHMSKGKRSLPLHGFQVDRVHLQRDVLDAAFASFGSLLARPKVNIGAIANVAQSTIWQANEQSDDREGGAAAVTLEVFQEFFHAVTKGEIVSTKSKEDRKRDQQEFLKRFNASTSVQGTLMGEKASCGIQWKSLLWHTV